MSKKSSLGLVVTIFIISIFYIGIQKNPEFLHAVNRNISLNTANTTKNGINLQDSPRNSKIIQKNQPIQTTKKNMDWELEIRKWIDSFPYSQEDTHSIISANPPEVAQALSLLDQRIKDHIINNNDLLHEDKSRILWGIYTKTNWLGSDNALQAIVQDHLTGLIPYELSQEISQHYQSLLTEGDTTINTRHDMLEIVDNILNNAMTSPELQQKLITEIPVLKEILMQQIRNTEGSIEEIKGLTGFSMDLYTRYANKNEIDALVPNIQSAINSNPEYSSAFYDMAFRNMLSQSGKASSALPLLLSTAASSDTSNELNASLSYLLKEDNNIMLSEVDSTVKSILLSYFLSQESNVKGSNIELDWKTATGRLNGNIR
ncbi:hypothetical protein [Methyloglobulus sp.]|uniref:hypothetical protein n=1 Tax=Methyloglobulus sp. TaxID=2518622 RepID=UPI0032B847B9